MTYEAAISLPEEAKRPLMQKLIDALFGFFNSLAVRLIVIFIVSTAATAVVADFVYPKMASGIANQLAQQLSDDVKKKLPSSGQILQTINKYNLAWLYITDTDAKLNPLTKAYAPDLPKYDIICRELNWKGKHYYEAVSHFGANQVLHIGVYAGPVILPNLFSDVKAMMPVSVGYLSVIWAGVLILTVILLHIWVSKPLNRLNRSCYSLLLAREAYSHVTGGGLSAPGAVTEVQNIGKGLRDIRRQYDEAVLAKTAKEEELKRQQSVYQEEKSIIAKQYEEQLATTQSKLTELHTKEAEEEFVNALGKELDMLKTRQQVCDKVLERLNDKFPTSIVYGAFFNVNKNLQCTLETQLGFNEKAVASLKKADNHTIARQVFTTGMPMVIALQSVRNYGLQQVVHDNSIRTIVYLPMRFQNRELGMLAFYFVQEGQVVQERLRVLRNVVELASRVLYQTVIFEEETEAARTDPLTGLRNKKFYSEVVPQVFERASINPEENPISIIMIDGDHFKAINDTYGHQIGDQMLQELAKTIRQCVRSQDFRDKNATDGDFLIRFGGEEFVVLMEASSGQRAMSVAERIRQTVESKHDWPGGIIKWTVSLGVASYPADGRRPDDILEKADAALYYVKEELGRNKVCHIQQVPKAYRARKKAAKMTGELGVFDAAGLLQSMATSQKTGVLTVQTSSGKNLWLAFENGKPTQARLNNQKGRAAITEFLVTFEDGNFRFQEQRQGANDKRMPVLESDYNVSASLERCLMDGALAQDNYNAARTVISSTELFVLPVPKEEFDARWKALSQLDDPPSPDEFSAMTEIVKRADGQATLSRIFKQLEQGAMPTHLMWRAAALMVQHGLILTKSV